MKKHLLLTAAFGAALAQSAGPAMAQISVQIGQPGFYGRIDIGQYPQPQIINPQPVIVQEMPMAHHRRPIYLRVPPGQQMHWERYCAMYQACGQPVYFVQDQWYRDQVMRRDDRGEYGRGDGDRRGVRRDDRRDSRGQGYGQGRGYGPGQGPGYRQGQGQGYGQGQGQGPDRGRDHRD